MKTQAMALPAARVRVADLVMLAKPRVNSLVVASTAVGYYMGAAGPIGLAALAHALVGTALVAAGAAALNQLQERDLDALMLRTRLRPLPDGRLQPVDARWFGILTASAGLLVLAIGANLLAAVVALLTLAFYVGAYTPLKRVTSLSTVVGAVPGAMPPLIGWAAARGSLDPAAWVLFGIVFLWQLPHFLAIAWMYRSDYARAGLPLLPVTHPDGRSTGRQAMLYAAALVPVSLAPAAIGLAGIAYFVGALALSSLFLGLALRFSAARTLIAARWLFLGSILYLPLLWILMVLDRL